MKTFEYDLVDTIPSKKNSKNVICRYNPKSRKALPIVLPSNKHKAWHTNASIQLVKQQMPPDVIKTTFHMEIILFNGDKRKFDLTNKAESIMDLLVDLKILEDDNYQVVPSLLLKIKHRPKNPGAQIIINTKDFDSENPF